MITTVLPEITMSDEDYVKDGEFIPAGEFLGSERAPITVNQSTDPADVIRTTQAIRLQILAARLKAGVNDDAKELGLDLQILRDLDNSSLTTRKIDVEEKAIGEAEKASELTNALLKTLNGRNPFVVDITSGELREDLRGRAREAVLPAPKMVPGITRQGTENLNYADFVDDPDNDDQARLDAVDDAEPDE